MSPQESSPKKDGKNNEGLVCGICFGNHSTQKHEKNMVWEAEKQYPVCDYCQKSHPTSEHGKFEEK